MKKPKPFLPIYIRSDGRKVCHLCAYVDKKLGDRVINVARKYVSSRTNICSDIVEKYFDVWLKEKGWSD